MNIISFKISNLMRLIGIAGLVVLIALATGCSISNSSGSISDSISSPSDSSNSSSDSSSGGDGGGATPEKEAEPETQQDAQGYANDVTQLAYTYGKQGGDIGALRAGVTGIASKRGLTNWEVDALTCQSIGAGAGKAGMSEQDFMEFSQSLFGQDLTKSNELRKGYETARPAPPAVDAATPSANGLATASAEASATDASAPGGATPAPAPAN